MSSLNAHIVSRKSLSRTQVLSVCQPSRKTAKGRSISPLTQEGTSIYTLINTQTLMCRTSKFFIICEGLCAENGACEAHADEVDGHCDESW